MNKSKLNPEKKAQTRHSTNTVKQSDIKTARLLVLLFVAGGLSTGLWVSTLQFPTFREHISSIRAVFGLALCILLTLFNLLARWFRWHFLIRRFTRRIGTRESLLVYFATLPALITPFCLGDLLKVFILRKRSPHLTRYLVRVWISERTMDVTTLLSFLLIASGTLIHFAFVPIAVAVCFLLIRRLLSKGISVTTPLMNIGSLLLTSAAWILPITALYAVLNHFQEIAFTVPAEAFSVGTLLGGATGLPLGIFVTGSTMIRDLITAGVPSEAAIFSVLIFRIGTVWFAAILGSALFFHYRGALKRIARNDDAVHFDELAPTYKNEIPEHVRARLLGNKTTLIQARLQQKHIHQPARGLDLGCGHGWYLGELIRVGYRMVGIDYSAIQLLQGSAYLKKENLNSALLHADAAALPFSDNSFDFVYSINALHHLPSPAAQVKAFQEIARVLRPGGIFLLHEMNTLNPIFRLYMGYLFPLLRRIDEGTERWILPTHLPAVSGGRWIQNIDYFTFVPDFVPSFLQKPFGRLERFLERSRIRHYSAHYQAIFEKSETSDSPT
jgi:SAM-dependent methyltransferase